MRRRLTSLLVVLVVLAASFASPVVAPVKAATGDWTQFRNGPSHRGYNANETILSPANVADLGVAWTGFTGGSVFSSPAVADGVVYVGSGQDYLFAYSVGCATGGAPCAPLWRGTTGAGSANDSSAAVANGVVYVGSDSGYLSAFAVGCGSGGGTCYPLWRGYVEEGAAVSSPAIEGGVVYVAGGPYLAAFEEDCEVSGGGYCSPLWTAETGDYIESSPAVADGVVYVGSNDGKVYAFAVGCASGGGTCTPLWTASTGGPVVSSPAVADGVVYVGSIDGDLYAFAVGCASGGGTCTPLWKGAAGDYVLSSPAVAGGVVYVGSEDGNLYAFAVGCASGGGTCTPLWTGTTGGDVRSSPAVANGVVYVGSGDHYLYAFAVGCASGGGTCAPLWGFPTGDRIWSSPTVAAGVVYVGSQDGTLYAFGLDHGAPDHLALRPSVGSILPGGSLAYKAYTADSYGNLAVDVTASTSFEVTGGTCGGATCTATAAGDHTVTGTYGGRQATATLHVFSIGPGDWPQFHNGPTHQGVNRGETVISPSNVANLQVVWQAYVTVGAYSSPAVADGVVYVNTAGVLYAFPERCRNDGGYCDPLWTAWAYGAYSPPAVSDGIVYVGDGAGLLAAYDAAGVTNCGDLPKRCDPLWIGVTDGFVFTAPTVADGVVYIGSHDGNLYAFPAACRMDGGVCAPLWTGTTDDGVFSAIESSPTVADGVVYVGALDGKLYAFPVGCRSDGGACSPTWKADAGGFADMSTAAVADGVVYVTSVDGVLHAYAAGCSSGGGLCSPTWTASIGTSGGIVMNASSPVVADGVVYAGSSDGNLYAFAVGCASGGGTCTPLWTGATGDSIESSPVVANGVIYVSADDRLTYAFAVGCASGGGTCAPLWSDGGLVWRWSPTIANGVLYVWCPPYYFYAYAPVPGAPTSVVAVAGDGSALVSWTAPSDGGSPITRYTVTSDWGGLTCTTTGATSCTVTGLGVGLPYTFRVTATNEWGTGPASDPSNEIWGVTVPGAPSDVHASPSDGSVTVDWDAPFGDGGSAITGYTVTSSPGGTTCSPVGVDTSCTVTGLTNGVEYTFTVTATNGVGTGPASSPSNAVTPGTTPGAPTNVVAAGDYGSATVTWDAPTFDGYSAITHYTVTSDPGGFTCGWWSGPLTCDVYGLTNGVEYTFTVTATNDFGDGPPSDPSNAVIPGAVPGAPSDVHASPSDGSVTVDWDAPFGDGGSAITGYTVTSSPGGTTCSPVGVDTSCTVTGLTNGVEYTFTVTATNGVGTGPASSPSNAVTPGAVPGAPTNVVATAGDGQATVTWDAPTYQGESAITGYTVTSDPDGFTCEWTAGPLTCDVSYLTNGVEYTFTVVATNGVGDGLPSDPSNAVTPAATPWTVGLSASQTSVSTGTYVTLTAQANREVGPTPYYIVILDSGGSVIEWCGAGTTCATSVKSDVAASRTYHAVVGASDGTSPVASSGNVTVTWTASIVRYGSNDIFATAAAVSANTFPSPCHCTVYIAYAYNFPDALAGAAAAGTVPGPVLFVATSGAINSYTAAELTRLAPDHIVALGSTVVISASVFDALKAYAPSGQTFRYYGTSRFDTAAAVSQNTFSANCHCTAYVAYAMNFPDALAAAAAAGTVPGPVLLVATTGTINTATKNELLRLKPDHIVALGSTVVISASVFNALKAYAPSGQTFRYYGTSRFGTARSISSHTFPADCGCVVYISGANDFNGALAASSAAGTIKGPLLLVSTTGTIDSNTVAELLRLKPIKIIVIGGTNQVSGAVFTALSAYAP